MLTQDFQWVAAYTAARSEKTVAARIKEDLKLETYVPLHRVLRKWSDRMKSVEVPLIPSYIFVKMRECDIFRVSEVCGVAGFVRFRSTGIAAIREEEIEALRRLAESMEEVHVLNTDQLKKDAEVRIVAGPFEGLTGTIVKDCSDGNFSVQIHNLNISLVMSIEQDVLEAIS